MYIILAAAAPCLEYTCPDGEGNHAGVFVSQQVAEIQVLHTVFLDTFLGDDIPPFHDIIVMDVADFIRFLHLIALINEAMICRYDEMMGIDAVMDFLNEIQDFFHGFFTGLEHFILSMFTADINLVVIYVNDLLAREDIPHIPCLHVFQIIKGYTAGQWLLCLQYFFPALEVDAVCTVDELFPFRGQFQLPMGQESRHA